MAAEVGIDVDSGRGSQPRGLDWALAGFAARQHGVVARWQLLRAGFTAATIDHRVRTGRLHPIHRGVYAVGHPVLSPDGHRMAAVLAGGDGAVLSHGDAAASHALLTSARQRFEVTVPWKGARRPRIQFHHALLRPVEVTTLRGIPVTTVPRTIFDLAAREPRRRIERAIREAEIQRLYDARALRDLMLRHPRARGTRTLRAVLDDRSLGDGVAREDFQERFLERIEEWRLPRPELDRPLWLRDRWIFPDCTWVEPRVLVELDGRAVHGTHRGFEEDRVRDRILHALEWIPIRVTWRQLEMDPAAVERDLRALIVG